MYFDKSEIFFWFLAGIIGGVAIGSFFKIAVPVLVGLLFLAAFLGTQSIFEKRGRQMLIAAVLLGIFLGLYRWQGLESPDLSSALPTGERLDFIGTVAEPPERKDLTSKIVLEVSEVKGARLKEPIRLLVITRNFAPYEYGDVLAASGKLEKPSSDGTFDYAKYLAKENIYYILPYPQLTLRNQNGGTILRQVLFKLRDKFELAIDRVLPEPQASLASGILLGKARTFPEDFYDSLRKTSTIHIVAVSGYNLTIVAKTIMNGLLFLTISRRFSFWIAVTAIILFTILVGAPSSAVRAAIMGILLLLAQHSGRVSGAKNALAFAAAGMVIVNPRIFRWDLGFQLSFLAMLGIIYLSPILREKLTFLKNISGLREMVSDTLSAQLMVAPWILFKFGTVSFIGLLANILILPVIPLSMFWSFIVGIAGNISEALGLIASAIPVVLLGYAVWVIKFFSRLPISLITVGQTSIIFVTIIYAIIILLIVRSYPKE